MTAAVSRFDVTFDPPTKSKVIAVQCYSSDKLGRCSSIGGILDGSLEDEVLRQFGEPDSSKITGSTKMMSYQKVGVFFYLEQQVVYMLGIHDPKWMRK